MPLANMDSFLHKNLGNGTVNTISWIDRLVQQVEESNPDQGVREDLAALCFSVVRTPASKPLPEWEQISMGLTQRQIYKGPQPDHLIRASVALQRQDLFDEVIKQLSPAQQGQELVYIHIGRALYTLGLAPDHLG